MLDEFVDTFQRYYKDGSSGTRDYRWFSGFLILLKLLAYMIYAASPNIFWYILVAMLFTIGAVVILIVEPYKEEYAAYNRTSSVLLLWFALFCTTMVTEALAIYYGTEPHHYYVPVVVVGLLPLVYITAVTINHFRRIFRGQEPADTLTSSLPDRLLHSSMYRGSIDVLRPPLINGSEQ